jgi:hemolysin-activating ACP:hemolysin acyltransferase
MENSIKNRKRPKNKARERYIPFNYETEDFAKAFSELTSLCMIDEFHSNYKLIDLLWLIYPAIASKYYIIFRNRKSRRLHAAVLFATVSPFVASKLEKGANMMSSEDWNSGTNIIILRVIAPHGNMKYFAKKFVEIIGKRFPDRYVESKEYLSRKSPLPRIKYDREIPSAFKGE